METNEFVAMLVESGAMKTGHFLLSSGLHSDRYVEKFDLLRRPGVTSRACLLIADRYRGDALDVIVGPTTGGVILAFEIARQLGVSAAYAERSSGGDTVREFRRGTRFEPGSRVLVVDDILTTGGSIVETIAALDEHPVSVAGAAVLVDRSTAPLDLGVPLTSLARMVIATWAAADCPLCAAGLPLTRPGTTVLGPNN
jgi:orotate phosphoribosyltransferase